MGPGSRIKQIVCVSVGEIISAAGLWTSHRHESGESANAGQLFQAQSLQQDEGRVTKSHQDFMMLLSQWSVAFQAEMLTISGMQPGGHARPRNAPAQASGDEWAACLAADAAVTGP